MFDNFPINGGLAGATVDFGFWVSDSFTISSPANATGVNLGVWEYPGDAVTALDWSIGTTPDGTDIASATGVSVTDTYQSPSAGWTAGSYNIDELSFVLSPNVSLAAGTYYLTIQNVVDSDSSYVFWDVNNAPGVDAWQSTSGDLSAPGACSTWSGGLVSGSCAESFQVLGATRATPEPASFALLSSGLALAAILRRKALRR